LIDLSGRIALITGASQGIGRACALELARSGATVALAARSADKLSAVAAEISAAGGSARTYALDVSSEESIKACAKAVLADLGKVDILVNNAGITRDGTFHKMTPKQWHDVVSTNLDSCFNVTRQVIDGMRERKWGRIIQISSINGQKGQYGQANYAAAKAGMHGFTISLAQENAKFGITVNTVSPGYIGTDMVMAVPEEVRAKITAQIPTGRLGRPDEIAYAVAFFLPDEAAWITGANLSANGGHYMGW
jgi:acetoacetyl-CoA reductase